MKRVRRVLDPGLETVILSLLQFKGLVVAISPSLQKNRAHLGGEGSHWPCRNTSGGASQGPM